MAVRSAACLGMVRRGQDVNDGKDFAITENQYVP